MSLWARFRSNAQANISVLFAMGFAVSGVVAAVAVDAAALYHERRVMQNAVDLAALSAAGNLQEATRLAQASLVEAQLLSPGSTDGLTVVTGRYSADPSLSVENRFLAGGVPANAVSVALERPGQLHFARGWAQSPLLGVRAIATASPQVSFSIGSRLASLNGGIANGVLNTLLGSNVSLTIADYNGLANVQVDLFRFLDGMAQELGVSAGSYNDLLNAKVNHGALLKGLSRVLSGADQAAASKLGQALGHNGVLPLGKIFNLGHIGDLAIGSAGAQGVFTTISALELIAASAGLSNGTHQVSLSEATKIPGISSLGAELAVGEPPQGKSWYAVGPTGTLVRTAQVRLTVAADVEGLGLLANKLVHLPLYVEAAHAEAIVQSAVCPTPSNPRGSATILARPGVLRAMVGTVTPASFGNFNSTPVVSPAKLVEVAPLGIPVLRVFASSVVEIAQTTPVSLYFSSGDIEARTVHTAKTSTVVSSLVGSLLGNLSINAPILGLGLNLTSLTALLKSILTPVVPLLDLTIARLLEVVGLKVGEVDVRVYGVRCSHPVLVG